MTVEGTDKATTVRRMFGRIAPRYDFLNHLLSLNLDKAWRRAAVRAISPARGDRILDACAGTLDLALLHAERGADVIALDFCRDMLLLGRNKVVQRGFDIPLIEADAMQAPFADATFDAATVAFGVRNLAHPDAGIGELGRLLRAGGKLAVLEFARPRSRLFRSIYYPYFQHVLPRIGALVSGDGKAYSYLPNSVMSFIDPEQVAEVMRAADLSDVRIERMTFGTVALVTGVKRA